MIFKLAKKNIKINIQNYLLYFMASIFNVAIYFVFQSIWFNKEINSFLEDDGRILMLFKGASIIILIFSIIFISYFSGFFIKKRKNELGLYSLLGMKKSDTAKLLFLENIVLGILSIIFGIIIGALFSKIFMEILLSVLVMSLDIGFKISIDAVKNTFLTFGILFLISSAYTSSMIYRFKLINLFNSDKETENIDIERKTKNIIGAVATLILIVIEIIAVINIKDSKTFLVNVPLAFFSSLIATFLFFGTFLSFIGNKLKNNKKIYYKGNNIISISNFLYRIKSNKKLLSVIALTNAVALTAISVTYSLDYNMKEIGKMTYPFSYSYISNDNNLDKKIESIISKYPEHQIINHEKVEISEVNLVSNNISSKVFEKAYLISESEYKRALESKQLNYESRILDSDDAILLEYYSSNFNLADNKIIKIGTDNLKNELQVKAVEKIEPLNEMDLSPLFLIKDEVYKKYGYNKSFINAYKVSNEMTANKLTKEIIKNLPEEAKLSYSQDMNAVLMFTSMMLFVGIFVGLVFLSSTASILYFKQLSEATDDKKRYKILNKIGFSNKDTKDSIRKHVRAIFILPAIVGIFHTFIALIFLGSTMALSITVPILTSVIVYMLIYFLYYTLTINTYVRIVTEN